MLPCHHIIGSPHSMRGAVSCAVRAAGDVMGSDMLQQCKRQAVLGPCSQAPLQSCAGCDAVSGIDAARNTSGYGYADLLLGLSKLPDLRRSRAGCRGTTGSREELAGEAPTGVTPCSRVKVCRLRELVGDSVTCAPHRATSAFAHVLHAACPRTETRRWAIATWLYVQSSTKECKLRVCLVSMACRMKLTGTHRGAAALVGRCGAAAASLLVNGGVRLLRL